MSFLVTFFSPPHLLSLLTSSNILSLAQHPRDVNFLDIFFDTYAEDSCVWIHIFFRLFAAIFLCFSWIIYRKYRRKPTITRTKFSERHFTESISQCSGTNDCEYFDVAVVVGGPFSRSPRMQYHTLSLAEHLLKKTNSASPCTYVPTTEFLNKEMSGPLDSCSLKSVHKSDESAWRMQSFANVSSPGLVHVIAYDSPHPPCRAIRDLIEQNRICMHLKPYKFKMFRPLQSIFLSPGNLSRLFSCALSLSNRFARSSTLTARFIFTPVRVFLGLLLGVITGLVFVTRWTYTTVWFCKTIWWDLARSRRYPVRYYVIQNPPFFPFLPLLQIHAWATKAVLLVDWHNLSHSILYQRNPPRMLYRIFRHFEYRWGYGDVNVCVSEALAAHLQEQFVKTREREGDKLTPPRMVVFRDYAPKSVCFTRRTDAQEKQTFWRDYLPEAALSKRKKTNFFPFIFIMNCSWGVDDDWRLLLSALYELQCRLLSRKNSTLSRHGEEETNSVVSWCVILTGEGPTKNCFLETVEKEYPSLWPHLYPTYFTNYETYAQAVGSADVGICVHRSTSEMDFPMKILDLWGCGVPAIALDYPALAERMPARASKGIDLNLKKSEKHSKNSLKCDKEDQNSLKEKRKTENPIECFGGWRIQNAHQMADVMQSCLMQSKDVNNHQGAKNTARYSVELAALEQQNPWNKEKAFIGNKPRILISLAFYWVKRRANIFRKLWRRREIMLEDRSRCNVSSGISYRTLCDQLWSEYENQRWEPYWNAIIAPLIV